MAVQQGDRTDAGLTLASLEACDPGAPGGGSDVGTVQSERSGLDGLAS
jgi:hypothetical protein